jgi:hypothetical protein
VEETHRGDEGFGSARRPQQARGLEREVGEHAVGAGALEGEQASSITASWSSQPFCAAAFSIAYSPLTW